MLQLHLGICACTPPPRTYFALLFGIQPTSPLLVFQIPVLHYDINYGRVPGLPELGHPRIFATSPLFGFAWCSEAPPLFGSAARRRPILQSLPPPPTPLLLFRSFRFELSPTSPNDTPFRRKDCRESIYDFGSRFALQCRGSCTIRGDTGWFCWGSWFRV
jgi:hypothetical protein